MKKYFFINLTGFILMALLLYSTNLYSEDNKRKISFIFYKSGVEKVEIVGNFGRDGQIMVLPLLREEKKKWAVNLNLKPDFYYYRYLLNRKHWRLDSNKNEIIEAKVGNIKGRFSLLEVYPEKYNGFIEMAEKFLNNKKKKWAIKVLVKAANKFPNNLEVYEKLGYIYEEDDLFGFAADAYIAAIERNPNAHNMRYLLAICYEKAHRYTRDRMYKKKANMQWLTLKKVEKYYDTAREHLLIRY